MAKRVRKRPITKGTPSSSVSRRIAQSQISTFHTLLKRRVVLQKELAIEDKSGHLDSSLCEVDARIRELGGMESYQAASKLGQSMERGGDTSRNLIDWLRLRSAPAISRDGKEALQIKSKLK